jgi:uncharacterized protein (DUF58 family)
MLIKKLRLKLEKIGKIYIIPTRYGLYFLLFVFILFLFSLIYGHSMAFTSTFLFVCLLMSSAVITNYNLKHIQVRSSSAKITTQVDHPSEVGLILNSLHERGAIWIEGYSSSNFDFEASPAIELSTKEKTQVKLSLRPHTRGIFQHSNWYLKTSYPIGLFTAWRPVSATLTIRVLPKSVDYNIVPLFLEETEMAHEHFMLVERKNDEDFYEYKPHAEGEPWRLIDWKVLAKSDVYLKKSFSADQRNGRYLFDYEKLVDLQHEERLSQLVFWTLQAIDTKIDFVVHLPGFKHQYFNSESSFENLWDLYATYKVPNS